MTELPAIPFDNSYAHKLEGFYVPWAGSAAPAPRVLRLNRALAADPAIGKRHPARAGG